nr:MAG TPA: portal protein [Caudoviricetes sp.]
MEMSFGSRLRHAWNAFTGNVQMNYRDLGMSYSYRADRPRMSRGNERSIVTSVYNRIALDVAALNVQHVRLDENGRFLSVIDDGLNNCLTLEANVDQTARSFIQDVVISMFDEGSVAIVPVDTTTDPNVSGSYDIQSLRVGQILDWYPQYIRARVYNEQTGRKEDIVVPKSAVAIIENPLYAVINEPNSTMQRLIRKLNLLDVIDEQSGSGKLDLIIQLPYVIKTEARRQQAENRRKDIESQLSGSKYGIAYTDGTEHITQLNRSVNNNLMSQIEYLTSMLYSQLGITQSILDGTADEKTMLNYNNRTIEPIISAIVDEMKRKFLTKTARSQRQSISFFRDPLKLVPVNEIAEIADKFTRNEIMTSNEIRQVVGMKPSDDPRADELRNKNLSEPSGSDQQSEETPITTGNSVEESASDLDDKISKQKSKK